MISSTEEFVRLRISDSPDEYMRAAHEDAPEAVWMDIISRFPDMRQWVAYNKTVPLSILEVLAHDSDELVRLSVAAKRKLSAELFDLLSQDSEEMVRKRVACNKKTPTHILKRLAEDREAFVREHALSRIIESKEANM